MNIKTKLKTAFEFLTNRKCENCKHNKGFICDSPKGEKCVSSVFPVGYKKKVEGGVADTNVGGKTEKGGEGNENIFRE